MMTAGLPNLSRTLLTPELARPNTKPLNFGLVRVPQKWSRRALGVWSFGRQNLELVRGAILDSSVGTAQVSQEEELRLFDSGDSITLGTNRLGMPDEKHTVVFRLIGLTSGGSYNRIGGWGPTVYDPGYYSRSGVATRNVSLYDGSYYSFDTRIDTSPNIHNIGYAVASGSQRFFIDGRAAGSSSSTIAIDSTDAFALSLLGSSLSVSSIAMFQGILADAELQAITSDFWGSLFEPAVPLFILTPSTGGITLSIADALHGHLADGVALTQAHSLSVAGSEHAQTADQLTLAAGVSLDVSEAAHSQSVDAPELTQAHQLSADDAGHAQTADAVSLTQAHVLALDDAGHLQSADAVVLSQSQLLDIADALQSHAAEQVTLSTDGVLAVASADHAHSAEAVALTQAHTLGVDGAGHAQSADQVTLSTGFLLVVAESAHAHSADSVLLALANSLGVNDAEQSQTADAVVLSQSSVLVVSDSLHAQIADTIYLGQIDVSAGCVIAVPYERTTFYVAPCSGRVH